MSALPAAKVSRSHSLSTSPGFQLFVRLSTQSCCRFLIYSHTNFGFDDFEVIDANYRRLVSVAISPAPAIRKANILKILKSNKQPHS